MKNLAVEIKIQPQSYELHIGHDLFDQLAEDLKNRPLGKRYAIISDTTVAPLWSEKLRMALEVVGMRTEIFTFPAGEENKNRAMKEMLENQLLATGYGRDSAVLALGGGVVGDLAGYTAATYMRGVPVVQIPTTTLSMADSSIGGKTGVDTEYGKNLIGAFHHPWAVYMDMNTLATLDERNYRAGLAELIKHGFIRNPEILAFFDEHREVIMGRTGNEYATVMEDLFYLNCQVKNDVVARDDKEAGLRQILNYGHTLGHGVEILSNFEMIHGECVGLGMRFAAYLAARLGLATEDWQQRQSEILDGLQMPAMIPQKVSTEELMRVMLMDKKTRDGQIRFVLTSAPGEARYNVTVEQSVLENMIEDFRKIKKNTGISREISDTVSSDSGC